MTAGALGLLIPLISGAVALLKWFSAYFSDSGVLRRLQLYLERQKARAEVEAERLLRAYDRIDTTQDKTGQDLLDDLNGKFKLRPHRHRSLWRVALRQILHLAILGALLTGCAHFHAEPALSFPPWPKLTFTRDVATGAFCMDQAEAQSFDRWVDKLRAFEAARQRLLKGQ